MNILETFHDYYNRNDPRTSEWFLISRPGMLFAIALFYIYFCVSLGPRLMKNRQPFELRKTLIVHNLIQILLSIYLFQDGFRGLLFHYNLTCQPVDYSRSPLGMRAARGAHLYFMCKIIELLDTVFFVLRKKHHQISFLHLYHHVSMLLGVWFGVRYVPGGHAALMGTINCVVHIIMYTYYMLAALGPEVQKYLWWKKYLTLLQLLQFVIVGLHSAQMLFTDCDFPKSISLLITVESLVFIYMFGSFYIKNHLKNDGNCSVKRKSD